MRIESLLRDKPNGEFWLWLQGGEGRPWKKERCAVTAFRSSASDPELGLGCVACHGAAKCRTTAAATHAATATMPPLRRSGKMPSVSIARPANTAILIA